MPLVELKKGSITDEAIHRRRNKGIGGTTELLSPQEALCGVIPSFEGYSEPKQTRQMKIPALPVAGKDEDIIPEKECAIQLTTQELTFLMDVWQRPMSSVNERYRRLCVSARRGNILHKCLISRCLLSFHSISLPSGRIKGLQLTKVGRKALGVGDGESNRHGGNEHKYWIQRMAERLRTAGFDVEIEAPIGGGNTPLR